MLNVVLCDDNEVFLKEMEETIRNYLSLRNADDVADVQVELATIDPEVVVRLVNNEVKPRLFFLDIDLRSEYNGILLAKKIREQDIRSDIVFVTSNKHMGMDTFTHKIAALGFVDKGIQIDEVKNMVRGFVDDAIGRYQMPTIDRQMIGFKSGRRSIYVDFADIMFLKTDSTKERTVELYERSGILVLKSSLIAYEKSIEGLIRCGKYILVNPYNVSEIATSGKSGTVVMKNGESFEASKQALTLLEDRMNELDLGIK